MQAAFGVVLTPTVASELRGAGDVKVVKVTLVAGGAAVGVAVLTGVVATVGAGDGVAADDGYGVLVGACGVAVGVLDTDVASADWLEAGAAEGPGVMDPGVASLAPHPHNVSAAATSSAIRTTRMAHPLDRIRIRTRAHCSPRAPGPQSAERSSAGRHDEQLVRARAVVG